MELLDHAADVLRVADPIAAVPAQLADGGPGASPARRPLAHERVRFVGEPVAAVVAQTLQQALDAAEAVFVDYEELPAATSVADALPHIGLDSGDIAAAAERLQRFAPYLAAVFPDTAAANGLIESPLRPIAAMQAALDTALPGR